MIPVADREVVDRWWQHFVATGSLPAGLTLVQGRLVRAVHRGELPSGPVHVKVMTFPRAKDRLRYLLRHLPATHEASMLRAVAAAGVPCPEVLDVRVARRVGLPYRSLLVLRTLPAAAASTPPPDPRERLRAEAALAQRLLAAGIVHRDLHGDNFLPLGDGRLAVLDLQSAQHLAPRRAMAPGVRIAVAARLARERPGLDDAAALAELAGAGLLRDAGEMAAVRTRIAVERARYHRARVLRCLCESTEFSTRWRWWGREWRQRTGLGAGYWWRGGRELREAWVGQRVLQLETGRPPSFSAYFENWWWLGGAASLYVADRCSRERIQAEVKEARSAWARFDGCRSG